MEHRSSCLAFIFSTHTNHSHDSHWRFFSKIFSPMVLHSYSFKFIWKTVQIINVLFFLLSCGSPLHPWYSAPAPVWITNYCEDHYNHCVLHLHTVRGVFRLLLRCSLRWSQITERRRRRWQVSGGATVEWGNYKANVHIRIICSVASHCWLHKSFAHSQQT